MTTPNRMNANPAALTNRWPCKVGDFGEVCCVANNKKRSNLSMINPKAMTAMAVRTQARKVLSLAA